MKGKIRKLLSVVVATAMTLSCLSVPALAADSTGDGLKTPDGTREFAVYQIFGGTVSVTSSGIKASDLTWGENSTPVGNVLVNEGENGAAITRTAAIGDKLSNGTGSDANGTTVQSNLQALSSDSIPDSTKLAEIEKYWNKDSEAYSKTHASDLSLTKESDMYKISGLAQGYYLIKDVDKSQAADGQYYSVYLAKVTDGTLTFKTKGSAPDPTKTVVDKTTGGTDSNTANIGDTLSYTITSGVSSAVADYQQYYYCFEDTLSKGLTLQATYANGTENEAFTTSEGYVKITKGVTVVVKLNKSMTTPIDVTKYFYVGAKKDDNGNTLVKIGMSDLKMLEKASEIKNLANTNIDGEFKVTITYDAVLNSDASVLGNNNEVTLEYSNDPNNSGTPSTDTNPSTDPDEPEPGDDVETNTSVKDITTTYTLELDITKIIANTITSLDGAVFKLTGTGMNEVVVIEDKYIKVDDTTQAITEGTVTAEQLTAAAALGKYYMLTDNTFTTVAPDAEDNNNSYASEDPYYRFVSIKNVKSSSTVDDEFASNTDLNGVTGATNDKGVVKFTGLGAGTYVLSEEIAPAGYSKIDDITFTVAFEKSKQDSTGQTIENSFWVTASNNMTTFKSNETHSTNGVMSITVQDKEGASLPTTGGIGTTIFYIAGTVLVLGAAVALITRRRMKGEVK
jgi:fimbrial isopeptide formation D2 family protein/LPXTG-motif cell wall-anchored protein